jgi:hypothetical protein
MSTQNRLRRFEDPGAQRVLRQMGNHDMKAISRYFGRLGPGAHFVRITAADLAKVSPAAKRCVEYGQAYIWSAP